MCKASVCTLREKKTHTFPIYQLLFFHTTHNDGTGVFHLSRICNPSHVRLCGLKVETRIHTQKCMAQSESIRVGSKFPTESVLLCCAKRARDMLSDMNGLHARLQICRRVVSLPGQRQSCLVTYFPPCFCTV
jgi:hypothetical protein